MTSPLTGCTGSDREQPRDPLPGVTLVLAQERAAAISDLRYDLAFSIPTTASEPVRGRVHVKFALSDVDRPVVLDFTPGANHLDSIHVAGSPSGYSIANGHIVIPQADLSIGRNRVEIAFQAGNESLNRNPEFLYTLFVPARAHLAFPCFDQPDLKARFSLELTIPDGWTAIANGAETGRETVSDGLQVRFAETEPISTYLFAFAAGRFNVETAERNGRTFRMFHRETDAAKVARNRNSVFDLHASALAWLEEYTSLPYPFGKFDFLLVPSFQFGGMEHPGVIYYNSASLLLEESATQSQMLGRASTIAHETAHMWFGDLVTMRWFDDVWMKEVFANFMAATIVHPTFPDVNHELRFLTEHYPAAYAVDRTQGTHPIRQELDNLDEAGSLYGAIIYHKAPIVMRQLELLIGIDGMRDGLREYLRRFSFSNATWLDLVAILDRRSDRDLAAWSRAWVEEAGRPTVRTQMENLGTADAAVRLVQFDPVADRGLTWTQQIQVLIGLGSEIEAVDLALDSDSVVVSRTVNDVDFVLPTGGGLAYGAFELDDRSRHYLLEHVHELTDPVTRGAVWVTLWDEMLDGRAAARALVASALRALPREDEEQNVQLIVRYLGEAFWRFLSDGDRRGLAPRLEAALRGGLARAGSSSLKSTFFDAFRSTVTSPDGVAFLARVWRRQETIPGLTLGEQDEASVAAALAIRGVPGADTILDEQLARFENPDRRARFEFVMPALSGDPAVREAFFRSLGDIANRGREPWVIEGLGYLNHPLRQPGSESYVRPALDLLLEIQQTGDIFFPSRWMGATLGGHRSPAAAATVRAFLDERPNYPIRLRRIILQATDDLFRASALTR